jgi:hypothetical protein
MTQTKRIIIAVVVILLLIGGVLILESVRRRQTATDLPPGSIPIYLEGERVGAFTPEDLERLEQVSFVDDEEGKTQEGWLLRDVLLLYVEEERLDPEAEILVSSSSREKSATVTWAEVAEPENWVMFDLSGRGTLKLVSKLEDLDTRDEWVQDVDRIEIGR